VAFISPGAMPIPSKSLFTATAMQGPARNFREQTWQQDGERKRERVCLHTGALHLYDKNDAMGRQRSLHATCGAGVRCLHSHCISRGCCTHAQCALCPSARYGRAPVGSSGTCETQTCKRDLVPVQKRI
jgi:hypothetical protein